MNLAEQMLERTKQVDTEDREKLDTVFNKYVLPVIERVVKNKGTEASFDSFSRDKVDFEVDAILGTYTLQNTINTKMKPYLEEKGFKVVMTSPNYYTYIRW